MGTGTTAVMSILTFLMMATGWQGVSASDSRSDSPSPAGILTPGITLSAMSGKTIEFRTQNGRTVRNVSARVMDLPHLVLSRNGALTAASERTLLLAVGDLVVPPAGVTVTLTLETYHGDPDLGGGPEDRITVWHESRKVASRSSSEAESTTLTFAHEFTATAGSDQQSMATPTDYYGYEISVLGAGPAAEPIYTFSQEAAFLLEREWIAPLNKAGGRSSGAAPAELAIYYCDMFPFQKDSRDPTTWLSREDVPRYVETELGPAMVEAFHAQTEEWGFAWSEAWTSYRTGEARGRLSVALTKDRTWFHGLAPDRGGHAAMSIRINGGDNADYETLTDGLMNTFHHELFHNLQRGIVQEIGGHGDEDGLQDAWAFFSEGTAVLASTVGQPAVQFGQSLEPRAYLAKTGKFIGDRNFPGELNASYGDMSPYNGAIYWRFLYEKCGGLKNGYGDPGAGMRVIRRTLETLYSGEIVDITSSTDLVNGLLAVMDQVLAGPEASSCPFRTFKASLTQMSRALQALRLEGGRCPASGTLAGCGFFDPGHLYNAPRAIELGYRGAQIVFGETEQPHPQGIRSSFGIDIVDVSLHVTAEGQPLVIEVHGATEGAAEFSVQLWKLLDLGNRGMVARRLSPVGRPVELGTVVADGSLMYVVPEIDTDLFDRLGLVITRLDGKEDADPVGAYTITLRPALGSDLQAASEATLPYSAVTSGQVSR